MTFFICSVDDDLEFVAAMDHFIGALAEMYDRPELYVVRIDNWFDHKWLRFAGKTKSIYAQVGSSVIMCAPAVWKSKTKTTLPPFTPKRVVAQNHFVVGDTHVEMAGLQKPLHAQYKQPSHLNLNNKLLSVSDSGLFFWLSSHSADSGRASLLVYHTHGDKVGGWYASFAKSDRWKLNRVKGAKRDGVDRVFSRYYEDEA